MERGGPSDYEIRESLKKPEHFLAVIECLSALQYENQSGGYGFRELAKSLDTKELIQLNNMIISATNSGKMTEHQLKTLLVDIYRLRHRPRSFWKTTLKLRNIQKAFDQIEDQDIMERITHGIYQTNILEKLKVIVRDTEREEKIAVFFSKNERALFASLKVAIWAAVTLLAPETTNSWQEWIPLVLAPGALSLSYFVDSSFTSQDLRTIQTQGLRQGIEAVRKRMKRPAVTQRNLKLVYRAYLASAVTAILLSIVPDIVTEVNLARKQEASKIMIQTQQNLEKLQRSVAKTPEEMGTEEFNRMVEEMKTMGVTINPQSPEMAQPKQSLINGHRSLSN
ncbi:MAG: hypothetical protein K2X47_09660 [Bdellovibrionales bacterium]|nr:hypothetical protein [Bdellovibrionales bacterium]